VGTMISTVDPLQHEIYFREVQPNGAGGLVFQCIHSLVEMNWKSGDSGTWCWTETGHLVGMAYASETGQNYCCILPMSEVVRAIEQLLHGKNVSG
jgi:hypothetical protein